MAGATQASCTINGVDFNYSVSEPTKSGIAYYISLKCNDQTCRYSYDKSLSFCYEDSSVKNPYEFGMNNGAREITSLDISNIDFRYGFYLSNVSDVSGNSFLYLLPFVGVKVVTSDGIAHYFSDYAAGQINDSNRGWLCVDPSNLVSATTDINYDSYSNVDISSLVSAIERLQQTMTETQETILDLTDIYNSLTDTAEGTAEDEETAKVPYIPSLEWLKQMLRDLGLTLDEIKAITEGATNPTAPDPDMQYKPSVGGIPDIGGTWDYVKEFLKDALIWMKLWFSGFVLLPQPVQTSLWALLIIAVVLGLLKVFLQ